MLEDKVYALYTFKFGYWAFKGVYDTYYEAESVCRGVVGDMSRCCIKETAEDAVILPAPSFEDLD